ncbi:MAG: triose-phosphate isomerase [Porticoccaceae bacterium]
MRKPLVAANWKMHGSREFLEAYFGSLQENALGVDVAVFPPFVYLGDAVTAGAGVAAIGAQNLSSDAQGAFTGEVSAHMLVDIGCRYVIVGHSERRALYAESNQVVAEKFAMAKAAGLIPVLCVGESLDERNAGRTLDVVRTQLQAVADKVGLASVTDAVIAYEPVWAIGSGQTATPEQAQEVHRAIRSFLAGEGLAEAAEKTRILYGGSVKGDNAGALFSQPDIDGGLVGGASLDIDEFLAICKSAEAN